MALPLLLVNFTAFTAISLGNMGLFILFFGQVVIIPIVTELIHLGVDRAIPITSPSSQLVRADGSDIGQLVPSAQRGAFQNVTPSYWMIHTFFFLSYLMTNAVSIYKLTPDPGASDWQIANRRSKAVAVTVVITILMIALPLMRYVYTGTETALGVAVAVVVGGGLGVGWYMFASLCGARDSDIFGIVQQMTPNTKPTTCIYSPVA